MAEARRKILFRIHAWIGLNLGYLLFIICFSGTMSVFSSELNWLADPALQVAAPAEDRTPISWQQMKEVVSTAYPQALPLYLSAAGDDHSVARALISYGPSDYRTVLINPYSGDVQGLKSGFNLVSFFRIFHKQFYIVRSDFGFHGTLIVGTCAILLLGAVITGLLSIKRWWRAFLTLRIGRSPRLFWSDLHRLTGVWALLIGILLSLTGIWYWTEQILTDTGVVIEEARPIRLEAAVQRRLPLSIAPLDLDHAAELARAAYPDLVITQVALPAQPGHPLTFSGHAGAWIVRDHADRVEMDPYSGAILDIRRVADLGAWPRWIDTADPLHFGTFAGVTSQIIWLLAGLLICSGILAGLYGTWLRLRQKGVLRRRRHVAALAVAPTLVVLCAGILGTCLYGGHTLSTAQRALAAAPAAGTELGPWRFSILLSEAADELPEEGNASLIFDGPGQPTFSNAFFWVGNEPMPANPRPAKRVVDRIFVQIPQSCVDRPPTCQLNLSVMDWRGNSHATRFTLPAPAAASWTVVPTADGVTLGEATMIGFFVLISLLPLLGWLRLQMV
mgnify:CR=1 FL=1|nr:PepSY-associated TM helix domain-containing protein [uncultured Dongia sp.]